MNQEEEEVEEEEEGEERRRGRKHIHNEDPTAWRLGIKNTLFENIAKP